MLDRQHGAIIFECALETDERDFSEAKRKLDAAEWRARKIGADWIHHCPDCQD